MLEWLEPLGFIIITHFSELRSPKQARNMSKWVNQGLRIGKIDAEKEWIQGLIIEKSMLREI